jgi:hypothetical protein
MKWNFECESERRYYLHNRLVRRWNGFRAVKKCAALQIRCAINLPGLIHLAQQTISMTIVKGETIIARTRKYSDSHFIDCDPVALRLCKSRCAPNEPQANRRDDEHEFDHIQIQNPRAPA